MRFVRGGASGGDVEFDGAAARVVREGTVIVDWTEGGVLTGVPLGDGYTLEIQRGGGIVTETLAVGVVIFTLGQSNMTGWFWDPTRQAGSDGAYVWNGADWATVTTSGAAAFAKVLSDRLGHVPVAFVDGSQPGSALMSEIATNAGRWLAEDADGIYAKALAELNASGVASPDLVLWIQGETDATRLVAPDAYSAGLQTLFTKLRGEIGDMPIIIGGLGASTTSDAYLQSYAGIRAAQAEVAAAMSGVTYVPTPLSLPLLDFVHLSGASRVWQAIDVAKAAATVLGGAQGGPIEIALPATGEAFFGTDAAERILGSGVADILAAGGGNDIAWAGAGGDRVDGGAGDDVLAGDTGNDRLHGDIGNDDLYGDDGDDILEGGEGNDVLVGGLGADEIYGGEGDDFLEGGRGANLLVGGNGDDTYNIKNTTDTSVRPGGWTDQTIVETADGGTDTVVTPFSWTLGANLENLVLLWPATDGTGNAGDNTIVGHGGVNRLTGLGGNDLLDGGAEADTLIGGAGNDIYIVDNTRDAVVEAADYGEDTVRSSVTYGLSGGVENLVLTGEAAIDGSGNELSNRLFGNAAANVLMGLGGNDVIFGGAGDLLDGGEGLDMAAFSGRRADYGIERDGGDIVVTNAQGVVRIVNTEILAFADGTYDVSADAFTSTSSPAAPALAFVRQSIGASDHVVVTAQAGAVVTLHDGDKVLGSGLAGADGIATLWAPAFEAGSHRLTVTARNAAADGATSARSNEIRVEAGTVASILPQMKALAADPTLAAVHLAGEPVFRVASVAEIQDLRKFTESVLSKIVGGYSFEISRLVAGTTYVTDYDSEGRVTERTTIQADGDTTINAYDASGRWISQVYTHDGLYEVHQYVVTGQAYARQDAIYTADNKLVSMTRTYADGNRPAFEQTVHDDGSQTVKNWSLDGSLQVSRLSASGSLSQLDRYAADGHHVYSESRSADGGKAIHTMDPSTGEELTYLLVNADRTQVVAQYNIVGKAYAEQIVYFDAAGKQVELSRYYGDDKHTLALSQLNNADGSSDVTNYDVGGRKTTETHSTADGARDAFSFTYVGASTSFSTATHTHWGPGGVRQFVDETKADGSHVQSAVAAGVRLVSHANVADTLNGLRGGGDIFVFGRDSGRDTIVNFEAGGANRDVVEIAGGPTHSFSDLRALMTKVGNDTLITFDAQDSLLLKNVALSSLTDANFHFVPQDDPMIP